MYWVYFKYGFILRIAFKTLFLEMTQLFSLLIFFKTKERKMAKNLHLCNVQIVTED